MDRSLKEEEHQGRWEDGNPNKTKVARLPRKGKEVAEEVPVFVMEDRHVHPTIARITNMNKLIVKKVNGMMVLKMQFEGERAAGARDSVTKITLRNITNLRGQIIKLQAAVRNEGGVPYQIPAVLNTI